MCSFPHNASVSTQHKARDLNNRTGFLPVRLAFWDKSRDNIDPYIKHDLGNGQLASFPNIRLVCHSTAFRAYRQIYHKQVDSFHVMLQLFLRLHIRFSGFL